MFIVTGANGFIGANLVQALRERGETPILAVDHYPSIAGEANPVADAPAEVNYPDEAPAELYLDKSKFLAWLDHGPSGIKQVYHLGANSSTTAENRAEVMANNTEYTRHIWHWCASCDVPFVYASSASTYGDGNKGFDDEVDPNIYQPMHLYGESKHLFDLFAIQEREAGKPQPPRWAGIKYFNVYGPMETHKGRMASMAYHWFHQIGETREARLFESYRPGVAHGDQERDFIYVKDAVEATVFLMNAPVTDEAPNDVYNVGTGEARTFADLSRAVFAALDIKPTLKFIPMPDDLRNQYQYYTQATVSKLRRAGFAQPFHSVEDGVAAYVAYLKSR